jgi:plasmid replication initiation protein
MEKEKENNNQLVVKDNRLNVYSVFNTALQLKIFSKILVLLRDNTKQNKFSLNISHLLKEFGINKNNYRQIKQVAKSMEGYYQVPDHMLEEGKKMRKIAVFDEIEIDFENEIILNVNESIKPFTIGLTQNFSSYQLKNVVNLKSKSSLRLYEILNQYKNIGKIKKKLIDLKLMIGVLEEKYILYSDFKRRVILKAQKELDEKTDITFTFEEKKLGRKVDEIVFYIKDRSKINDLKPLVKDKENQQENIIEAQFEEIIDQSEVTKEPSKKSTQEVTYPFTLNRIDELINLGISKKDIENEFIKLSQEIDDFSEGNIEKLLNYFLNQDDVKNVISGKKEVKSRPSYIFTLIKNRSFFNQETLTKIIKKSEIDNKKEEEKENKKEKYQIRNAEPFWQFIRNYLDLKKKEDWGKLLNFELLNFSLIENNVMYLILSKSDDNSKDKFFRDNLLREKKNLIITINKMLEMDVFKDIGQINDLKISIEDEYSFHG